MHYHVQQRHIPEETKSGKTESSKYVTGLEWHCKIAMWQSV
jgi:hypothetical protein